MPIYKRCSRCGSRIPSGSRCPCLKERHKEYDRMIRDKKSKQFYDSGEWTRARADAMDADQGIDVYLFVTKGQVKPADTVHHIIPLRDDWEKRCDINNLMSLHHDTHSLIESLYKKDKQKIQRELLEMVKRFRETVRQGGV